LLWSSRGNGLEGQLTSRPPLGSGAQRAGLTGREPLELIKDLWDPHWT